MIMLHIVYFCPDYSSYYRGALVYVPGGVSILALIGLACLMAITYQRSRKFKGCIKGAVWRYHYNV